MPCPNLPHHLRFDVSFRDTSPVKSCGLVRVFWFFSLSLFLLVGCGPSGRPFTSPPSSIDKKRQFSYEHNIELFKVQNGLLVAIVPDNNTNLVKVDMRYKVGAAEDPPGKEGIAHLVEHIMFEFQKDAAGPTLTHRLRDRALFHNASTTWDRTNYTATGSADELAELLKIEGDRMSANCSQLSEELFLREREIVRQEISWRNFSQEGMNSVLRKQFFPKGHPYYSTPGGTDSSVSGITREDICTFMEKHYAPDRAILVVSGAVEAEQAKTLIGPIFGSIQRKSKGSRTHLPAIHFLGKSSRHTIDIKHAAVTISFPYPAWGSQELVHADLFTDILYEELSAKEGSEGLKSVDMGIVGDRRSRAIVYLLTPKKAGNQEAMVDLFFNVRKKALKDESTRFFITRRSLKRADLVTDLERFSYRAERIADYLQYTSHLRFMLQDMSNLQNILLKDLEQYQRNHFQKFQSHVAFFVPSGKSEESKSEIESATAKLDISPWQAPIDPKEAGQALSFQSTRVEPLTDRYTLKNGLRVILAPTFEYPTVDMRMVFAVGDAMDPVDQPGLAHWTAKLISVDMDSDWTAKVWNRVIRVREMGGSFNAHTTDRATVFRYSGLSMYADALLWKLHWLLESGTIGSRLKLFQKVLAEIKKEEKDDKRSDSDERIETKTNSLYSTTLRTGLYGKGHPYAVARTDLKIIAQLKASELEAFRNANYRANQATLIITGRFHHQDMRKMVKKLFGSWPAGGAKLPSLSIADAAAKSAPVRSLVVDKNAHHPQITVAFPAGRGLLDNRALRLVIQEMIDQRISSVREKLGASYGVSVSYNFNQGPGSIIVRGTVNQDKSQAALKLILMNLEELRMGIDIRDDFSRARRKVLRSALADTANATSIANQFVTQITYDLPNDYEDRFASTIAKLTLEEVTARLATDLNQKNEVLIIRSEKKNGKQMFDSMNLAHQTLTP